MVDALSTVAAEVARELRRELGGSLVAVYLHGSGALGDFDPLVSDVDLLVVLADDAPPSAPTSAGEILHAPRSCPGVGIEASAVSATAALHPSAPWPFLVHVTTGTDDKVVVGADRRGDPDLILHYAVTRAAGVPIDGPPATLAVGEVDRHVVLRQIRDELRWAATNASAPYAVLNACRALRYQTHGVICSKTDAGIWALEHNIEPSVVAPAVEARRTSSTYGLDTRSEAWVVAVADNIPTT